MGQHVDTAGSLKKNYSGTSLVVYCRMRCKSVLHRGNDGKDRGELEEKQRKFPISLAFHIRSGFLSKQFCCKLSLFRMQLISTMCEQCILRREMSKKWNQAPFRPTFFRV